jgi:hypothetical protein
MKLVMRVFFILSIVSIVFCPGANSYGQTKEDPLIINFAYAPERIRQGNIWKIYLSVTDSESKMHRVVCQVRQPGNEHAYRPSTIYLKKGMEKQFTGHFAMPTNAATDLDDLILELSILDRAGNERKTFRFPLEFDRAAEPMKPLPPDMEKDLNQRIGTIDIDWHLG